MSELSIKQLAELSGKTQGAVYYHAKRLGVKPTVEFLVNVKNGRPKKY